MKTMRGLTTVAALLAATLTLSNKDAFAQNTQVIVDGSSTVAPISIAVAEAFQAQNAGTQVAVATSGTGGGFKKFCAGETDISNASRPIKQSEIEACEANGINFVELPVAFDGLAVVTSKQNDWAECLTVEELNTMWNAESEGTVTAWNQVRSDFPSEQLTLFGPGTDSGTFDYFVEAVLGEDDIRADFTPSEDDNVIVTGVSGGKGALGYFGLAYYEENADKLNVVAIDGGAGCVSPTAETVQDGTYAPLSRPIFIYVKATSLAKPAVKAYVDFYLQDQGKAAAQVGYISLPPAIYETAAKKVAAVEVGSIFKDLKPGTPITEAFK
ncbi:MAG: PstS family phosphate ABC transporter substrate-binding protein [Cyanobacteriota bacterium]|nr:PstS family phosphate ABC transporter substrate-binding protein [Cyanobacteriota bacterium]